LFCFSSEDRLLTTDIILQSLNDLLIQLFYEFLEWVLPEFVHLNKLFQSEKGVIVTLYSKMTVTYTGNRFKTIVGIKIQLNIILYFIIHFVLEFLHAYMKKQNRPLEVDPNDSSQFLRDEAFRF